MLIMSQDREMLVNLKSVNAIFIEEYEKFVAIETEDFRLGSYDSKDRALDILEDLVDEYCLLTNEEKGYVANGVYYMPKE